MIKGIKMMNSSTVVLDEILFEGKRSGDNTGIGFSRENSKKRLGSPTRKWVAAGTKVAFSKEACYVNNSSDQTIKQETRSSDNCYLWTPQRALSSRIQEDAELWLKNLEHTNYENIQQLISKEAVEGLPKLVVEETICGECQREKGVNIISIRSYHGREFENSRFHEFCNGERIKHEISAPISPHQNSIVERKNMTLQEMARVTLHEEKILVKLWAEAINTTCHIHNRITLRPDTDTTTYEIWSGKNRMCNIFIFLAIALTVYNKRTQVIMESINVKVIDQDTSAKDEDQPDVLPIVNHNQADQTDDTEQIVNPSVTNNGIKIVTRIQKNHPIDMVIGQLDEGMTTRKKDKVDYRKMMGLLGKNILFPK
ncbi:hypothetical protein LIER_10367 [Lithospermum erythrorhizon]|uniref:Integrase catalytic domain-containing protein n=1 Tax=Lithospermum erythrorhizon TaxID=34254 RepID=A0AAV3PL13_LITER